MIDPNSELTAALRHLGTLIAGILITHGWVDESYGYAVVGFIMACGMILLAWWNKRTVKRTTADTVAVALQLPAGTRGDTLNSVLVQENLPPVNLEKA